MLVFPSVHWKRETATFVPAERETRTTAPTPAALVFPFYGDRVVLADIVTRGWCIPSGHLEAGESAEDAVRREAHEEAGALLGQVRYIGYFVLTDIETGNVRYAPTFIGEVMGFSEIPPGTESRGMQMVTVEDISDMYFAWDDLLAAVFAYAYDEKTHHFRAGISLATLTSE